VRFEPYAPFHPAIAENTLTTLDSAGSCLVLKGHVAQTTRFTPPELGIVGWGDDINAQGYLFWLDPSTSVWHP
jgi:hypothetical protein